MKNSEYYYGCSADRWVNFPYLVALDIKIKQGILHLSNLIKLEQYYRDLKENHPNKFSEIEESTDYNPINLVSKWIDDVMRAIEFNQTLLKESNSQHKLLYGEISDIFLEDLAMIKDANEKIEIPL